MMLPSQMRAQRIVRELETNTDFSQLPSNPGDSTNNAKKKSKNVPAEVKAWTIDIFGNRNETYVDTLRHLYQNNSHSEGENGSYNTLGNLGSPRLSRIYMNRRFDTNFIFAQPFDQFITWQNDFRFFNTKSPYMNLSYNWCGSKITGYDDFKAIYSNNIGKKANFTERFIHELTDQGIVLSDVATTCGTLPTDAKFICSRTHTIDQILGRMMKESDNLYAEAMLYQIAASTGNRPATAKHARTLMQQLIRQMGLNPKGYRMADGSGLSLYNYLSAELLVRLLRYAWHNQQVYDLLQPSLPIAGEDGTLKKRMKSPFTSGNVRAKTGTVTGVSSLAGYCTAANGHELCFAIINQGIMHNNTGRHFQDRICMALCQP